MSKKLRAPLLKKIDSIVYNEFVEKEKQFPVRGQEKKYEFVTGLLQSALKNLDKGYISKQVAKKFILNLISGFSPNKDQQAVRDSFKQKYGIAPPLFIVVSPTQQCNLNCIGCYAASCANTPARLDFEVFEKAVDEAYHTFGNRFMTISGGEPFLYRSGERTIFDIWKKYDDMIFLVYTNGTCITPEVAGKLAELSNVTPAISVEGFEKETDARRGKGVFKKILEAMENLRNAGVPFGVSVTATSKNVPVLTQSKFYDYYLEKQGATYMWMFQIMPIGRAQDTLGLMVNPKQRITLYNKWKVLLHEKRYPIADFWNSGILSNGCIAYGRDGGYLYIDWNGNIMPCVFVPYYVDNIAQLYKEGKTLGHALLSDFFVRGREWQDKFNSNKADEPCNLLMPCSIRDHYKNFRTNILTSDAKPSNPDAAVALKSNDYSEVLDSFDSELKELSEPIWDKEYGTAKEASN